MPLQVEEKFFSAKMSHLLPMIARTSLNVSTKGCSICSLSNSLFMQKVNFVNPSATHVIFAACIVAGSYHSLKALWNVILNGLAEIHFIFLDLVVDFVDDESVQPRAKRGCCPT